jgi:hypothetical protein
MKEKGHVDHAKDYTEPMVRSREWYSRIFSITWGMLL